MPPENSDHVGDLKVRPAHRSGWIVTADEPRHHRIDAGILCCIVRQDLFRKEPVNRIDLDTRSLRGEHMQARRTSGALESCACCTSLTIPA